MTNDSQARVYVYCIARGEALRNGGGFHAPAIGGRGNPVRVVQFMDLAAVVSDCDQPRYDIRRENTLAHQVVVEETMTRSDVLPVRFGTVARSEHDVEEKLLKRKFGELHYLLRWVRDRVELGVKVFWNRERLFPEITAESPQIRVLRDEIAGKPPEETHYQRIRVGQLVEEWMLRKRDWEAQAVLDTLRPLAVETKVNKILTDMMVLNGAFLVEKSQEPEFDTTVSALGDAQAGRLIFKYAGPLPAYNFVNLVVQWDEE